MMAGGAVSMMGLYPGGVFPNIQIARALARKLLTAPLDEVADTAYELYQEKIHEMRS